MAQAQTKKLAVAAAVLIFSGTAAVVIPQAQQEPSPSKDAAPREAKTSPPPKSKVAAPADSISNTNSKVLVFRNQPSWNRNPDFEDRLEELGIAFEVKPSSDMETIDLSTYRLVVIPGAQWRTDFYSTLMAQSERIDRYVTNGGVLALELNGAENDGVLLPRGVSMARHGAVENTILVPDHPALAPFGGGRIRANFASHGFLEGVPSDALVLAAETVEGQADLTKPTYVEYKHGKGRVIAACQCFHDQDRSGRGALMPTLLTYALERRWHVPKK